MTNLFIADRYQVIRDTEKYPIRDGMIEKLDAMLTEYGVTHFFTLPSADPETGLAKDDECLNLCYDSKDEIVEHLVYALWLKTVRGFDDDDKLRKSFAPKVVEVEQIVA